MWPLGTRSSLSSKWGKPERRQGKVIGEILSSLSPAWTPLANALAMGLSPVYWELNPFPHLNKGPSYVMRMLRRVHFPRFFRGVSLPAYYTHILHTVWGLRCKPKEDENKGPGKEKLPEAGPLGWCCDRSLWWASGECSHPGLLITCLHELQSPPPWSKDNVACWASLHGQLFKVK